MNQLAFNTNEDLFYELSQYLTLQELRELCSTNRQYRNMCRKARFQELFKQKLQEEKERPYREKINLIYDNIVKCRIFNYIVNDKVQFHVISYALAHGISNICETVRGYQNGPRENSILRKLYDQNVMINVSGRIIDGPNYILNSPTEKQIKEILDVLVHRSDFDINKVKYIKKYF